MKDDDDNLFDEDDALDYIIYEEAEKEVNDPHNRSGCLGVGLVLVIPVLFFDWLAGTLL